MSIGRAISGSIRGLLIAAAASMAVVGLLVIFHPFGATPATPTTIVAPNTTADTLHSRIDAAREALKQTEATLDNVNGKSPGIATPASANGQFEAQIAAAIERRDLAIRHTQAIRDALKTGADLGSLAEIRDSVVIGQLISRQSTLDLQLAEQGARLKANHPTMRALNAQKAALVLQIKAEAASIASALETEARLDDTQIKLLQSQLGGSPVTASTPPVDAGALEAQATAQRAELDSLMDAYFGLRPGATTPATAAATTANLLSPLNLFVAGVAAIAALMFQIALTLRRRRQHREALDLALFESDLDLETVADPVPVSEPDLALRRAS